LHGPVEPEEISRASGTVGLYSEELLQLVREAALLPGFTFAG
jgi:hypothetical protein